MNKEPLSIRILIAPLNTPTARNALRHDARAAAINDRGGSRLRIWDAGTAMPRELSDEAEVVLVQVCQRQVLERDDVGCVQRDRHVAADLLARRLDRCVVGEQSALEFDHVAYAGTGREIG